MKKLLISAMIAPMLIAAFANAETPAGANSANCDVTKFVAIRSEKTGKILYWNNPTCKVTEPSIKKEIEEE